MLVHQCAGLGPRALEQIADAEIRRPSIEICLIELVELNSHDSDNIIPCTHADRFKMYARTRLASCLP